MKEVSLGWFVFVSLSLIGALALEIPFFRGKARRRLAWTLGFCSVLGVLVLVFSDVGASYPLRTALLQKTAMTEEVKQGMDIYFKYGCPNCHQLNGWGTPAGPDLAGEVSRRGKAWVREYLVNPNFRAEPSLMLHYSFLTDAELERLLAFLAAVSATKE